VAEQFELTEEMRAQIAVDTEPWRYEVTTTGVRAFARGVGYDDPVYYDESAARAAGHPALPAPPGFVGMPVYLPRRSDPTFTAPPGTGPRPRFGMTNVLDGGTQTAYERQLYAGDMLSATERIVSLDVKRSRSLGTTLHVRTEATFRDPDGAVAARQTAQWIFY
jgi:N-terminal half of MaoC dehydratase